MPAVTAWLEIADRVWARRYDPFDVNVAVVAGDQQALLVDVRGSLYEGAALRIDLEALPIHRVTALAFTHAHLDHCLGAGAFEGLPVYGAVGCRTELARNGARRHRAWVGMLEGAAKRQAADSAVVGVTRPVATICELDLGGRSVTLAHLGRGHTDHDLVVHVPDADVLVAGDLVEVGAPPQFDDAFIHEWATTLAHLERFEPRVVVPGHGPVADRAELRRQQQDMEKLSQIARQVTSGDQSFSSAAADSPFPAATTQLALLRAGLATARSDPDGG